MGGGEGRTGSLVSAYTRSSARLMSGMSSKGETEGLNGDAEVKEEAGGKASEREAGGVRGRRAG